VIAFRHLSLSYRDVRVLDEVTFDVRPGEILAVVGPSGCGKTTLLKAAAGLLGPTTPGVTWAGEVTGLDADATSMIFQDLGLLPWKTVRQNIELPLRWAGVGDVHARVQPLVEELGLGAHLSLWPRQLSGGLAQRVALARALATRPRVLLMDEPFSALDALTRERAQDLLADLWRTHQPTILLVTHSIDEAVALGHRVVVLTGSMPGRVAGTVVLDSLAVLRPTERRTQAEFFTLTTAVRTLLEGNP
jgi:ABC-type nitrate/sulfonate/bicarbonate transport system ATPase subunit